MKGFAQSLLFAGVLAAAVVALVRETVLPTLGPYVGPPDAASDRLLRLPSRDRLALDAEDGAVRIQVADDASQCVVEAAIRLYRRVAGDQTDLEQVLTRMVSAESDGDTLRIRSLPEDWPETVAARVDYTITVPRGTDIEVNGVNGNVAVDEGCGSVRVQSTNADVAIASPRGPVTALSTNGRMRLSGSTQAATLETLNGSIRATVHGGRLSATSVNGHVSADLMSPEVVACLLTSENGDVTVRAEPEVGFRIEATTPHGQVRSSIDLDSGAASGGVFRGQVGDGAALLTLSTSNGTIRLARR